MPPIDRVRAALDGTLRSAKEIGIRCMLPISIVRACLRELRRGDDAEYVEVDRDTFRWRRVLKVGELLKQDARGPGDAADPPTIKPSGASEKPTNGTDVRDQRADQRDRAAHERDR